MSHADSPFEEERSSWLTAWDSFGIRMSDNDTTPEFEAPLRAAIYR